jgi:hypothetical protein
VVDQADGEPADAATAQRQLKVRPLGRLEG